MFDAFANVGVIGRAVKTGIAEIECINPRDFAENSYGCIDKRPFGGGPGMIMMAEPLKKSIMATLPLIWHGTTKVPRHQINLHFYK